ncbi:MAG: VOC family protein [Pleurocapsa minor GSE-CHR-MK-17-07R]|nr:VOC family protein [Pleurocapsa minor GSE-CHR-MK 17-07R]
MNKVFSWIEIPVQDIERAARFYGQLLGREVTITDVPPRRMATLYFEPNEVGGSLLQSPGVEPGNQGAHVYLNAGRGSDLEAMIERVRTLGAEIVVPVTPMGNDGRFASFRDTEGNILSLFAEH